MNNKEIIDRLVDCAAVLDADKENAHSVAQFLRATADRLVKSEHERQQSEGGELLRRRLL